MVIVSVVNLIVFLPCRFSVDDHCVNVSDSTRAVVMKSMVIVMLSCCLFVVSWFGLLGAVRDRSDGDTAAKSC